MTLGFGARTRPEPLEGETLFLQNLGWIERVAASLCAKYGIRGDDAEDFASWAKLRLIENDYAVFRKFRGESSITTYLTIVVASLFRDYRVERWGRWRPSAAAQRRGALAVRLETLVYRDGHRLDQAAEILRTSGVTDLPDRELAALLAELPPRAPLRPVEVGPEPVESAPSSDSADERVVAEERERERRETEEALLLALQRLPDEDRLILRMRFWEGMSVADIARALALPQKPLYRRLYQALVQLRKQLEAMGVSRERARRLLQEFSE